MVRQHTSIARCFLLIGFGLLAAACAPAAPQAAAPKAPMKVRVGITPVVTAPFLFIAKNQGTFQKEGIEVEWQSLVPPAAMEAMAAGAVDAAGLPGPTLLTGVEKGVDAKLVLHLAGWSDPRSTFFVRSDSGINGIRDLKGKKVGINNYGGNFDIYLRHMLEQNGLDPKNDVQILEVPIQTIYQALDTKQIDCGVVSPELVSTAEENFPGKFKPLFTFREVPGIGERPNTNNIMLAMSGNMLKNDRATAKQFLKVILDTQKWGYANVQEAQKIWATEVGFPAMLKLKDPFGPDTKGKMDIPTFDLQIKLMNRYGYLKKELQVKDFVDESLVDEINAGK